MKVLMVGHDFDYSAGGGISRYANGIYENIKKMADVHTISTGNMPRPLRVLMPVSAYGYDVVHLVYPDVAKVIRGKAKMVSMWHDLKMITKYVSSTQAKHRPKFVERFNIASSIIRKWVNENYTNSDAIVANTSMVINDVKTYAKSEGIYDKSKLYRVILLGIEEKFLRAKIWHGERRDFVYIGDIHMKHKNLDGLLETFDAVAKEEKGTKLHIFTKSPDAELLVKERLQRLQNLQSGNVLLHYHASDEKIIDVLSHATACLYLSKEEGFGLPILESMAVGTPTIVLKGARIPEEVVRHAIKANEEDVHSIALKLLHKSAPASTAAIKYARSLTWEEAARKTFSVYKELLEES